ncbi:MAG: Gfo/Idh/MocA family oxidoreductase [Promethearchaeota archaeon]|nr:MAG: Gfo/Idh/MocA family oxidoreductase [Candidatus Lokiarchaeota archaeon]
MEKLKVGIIGTGVIFDLNILGYLNRDDVQITCLCNRTVEKAKQKIEKFNLDKNIPIYADYKEMLEKENLDLVEILLPHHLHADATIYAAQKGLKGISVQKPMALTLEEADKMIDACKKSGSILSIYENFVFAPHIIKAKELLDNDYIGDPSSIRIKTALGNKGGWKIPESAELWRKDPKKIGGGQHGSPILFDNGWHAFCLAIWFFNEEIEKVFAWTDKYQGLDAPAYVIFKYKQSKEHIVPQYGNMEFVLLPEMDFSDSKYYPVDEFIEIIASRGIMKINQGTSIGNKISQSKIFPPIVIIRNGKVETYKDFEKDWKFSFINATNYLIDAVKNNKDPILSGTQARSVLRFNLAAIKSVEQGTEIVIDETN